MQYMLQFLNNLKWLWIYLFKRKSGSRHEKLVQLDLSSCLSVNLMRKSVSSARVLKLREKIHFGSRYICNLDMNLGYV